MNKIKHTIKKFLTDNQPVFIVNTSTDMALLCLNPVMEENKNLLILKFDSLNDRGGNSVNIRQIQGLEKDALYIENETGNILMLQGLTLENYNHYIKKHYYNAPSFTTLKELKTHLAKQKGENY